MTTQDPLSSQQSKAAPAAATSRQSTAAPAAARPASRAGVEEIAFGVLLVLSVGGIAVADFSARWGLTYWLVMVPLFALNSLYVGWRRARDRGRAVGSVLLAQVLHWSVLAGAVYLIFLLARTARLDEEDAGLVALIALAVTTLLAGIHFDRRLAVLGGLLGLAAVCAALVERFFWMLLIPALVAGAAVILLRRRAS